MALRNVHKKKEKKYQSCLLSPVEITKGDERIIDQSSPGCRSRADIRNIKLISSSQHHLGINGVNMDGMKGI